jgi:DNA-directed RNA polymerase, mitochondrial
MLLALPFFDVEKKERGRSDIGHDNLFVMHWDPSLHELVAEALAGRIGKNPLLLPLLEPPVPWTQTDQGVTDSGDWMEMQLVDRGSAVDAAQREAIAGGQMDEALEGINYLQSVPLSINRTNLDLLLEPDCPASPKPPVGHVPPECDRDRKNKFMEGVTRVRQWGEDMTAARLAAIAGRFWEPKNWDFRGRIYDIPNFNYQRNDPIRALITFADGEPITEDGIRYLKSHVAAQADGVEWGSDKKPSRLYIDKRIAWVDSNHDPLRAVAQAALKGEMPRADLLPPEDDHPWAFIAACVELYRANNNPEFITHHPVSFDACCSGVQQMSAMTRDEVGGRLVNLVPGTNEDFYEAIAVEVCNSPLVDDHWRTTGTYEMCAILMDGERDRKLVKAPTMTWNYGATLYRMTEQVREVLAKRGRDTRGARGLALAIDAAIRKLAPRTVEAGGFLKQLVDVCTAHGIALSWTTLDGVPVLNHYYRPDMVNYNFPLDGKRVRVWWAKGDTDEVRGAKARNSVTANFVHSMDATHLRMVARGAKADGIDMLGIHDCFACLPSRARRFNQIIREQFVQLHEHDALLQVLEETRRRLPPDVVLPSPPPKGTLDVSQVRNSEKAFS